MSLFDIYVKPIGGVIVVNNEPVSLETAKKLKRHGYPQGQSSKFYEKRKNCSVYDLKDKAGYRNEPVCYDAPNTGEMINFINSLESYKPDIASNVSEQVLALLKHIKANKKREGNI